MAHPLSRRRRLPADPVTAWVSDLTHDGRGVAHVDGKAVFIHGALPGETVSFRYTGRRRGYDEGATHSVMQAAPARVEPRCPHAEYCGGCALQHLDPDAQVEFKQKQLLDNLERIGHVEPEQVDAPLRGPIWGYRRRARLSVRDVKKKQRVLVGFRERGGRLVADCRECHILRPEIGERLTELSALVGDLSVRERVPQFEVACDDTSAALVLRHMDPLTDDDRARLRRFASDTGIAMYLQPKGPDTVELLAPQGHKLHYAVDGGRVDLRFEPLDFVQINAALNEAMVQQAMEWLQPQPGDRVLDLFCGIGNFALPLALRAGQVTGIEGDGALVRRATENARRNRLDNAAFHAADLSAEQADAPWAREPIDRVLLDPPRSGAAQCLDWIHRAAPEAILYVSCHPASMARDAGELVNRLGWRLRRAGVMDMFPHTAHAEAMALFTP